MSNITYKPYNVMLFDINKNILVGYDIMSYLVRTWVDEKKRKTKIYFGHNYDQTRMPKTFEEFKEWILNASRSEFWSRCQYEFIVTDWPCQKNEQKIDVYNQIEFNIDVITTHFMSEIKRRK